MYNKNAKHKRNTMMIFPTPCLEIHATWAAERMQFDIRACTVAAVHMHVLFEQRLWKAVKGQKTTWNGTKYEEFSVCM
jgi:hypothetical protein